MNENITKILPFRYKCVFWAYTLPGAIYAVVCLILCGLNPFWFRQAAMQGLENQVHGFGRWRNRRMQHIFDKYTLLHTIKNS